MSVMRISAPFRGVVIGAAFAIASTAALAQNRQFSFAYDQPKSSGYGVGAEMFNKKLMELSKGTLSINQYPSAQLGTEAQTMQKVQTGDIDFVLLSTANASTAQQSQACSRFISSSVMKRTPSKCSAIPR
jgi:TRAP-type transport system periplasmic protein